MLKKKMNTRIYILFCFFQWIFITYLVAADWTAERVYLQTDKQTYLSGEMIWIKSYITDMEGRPNPFSKIMYVELLDESSHLVQAKIELVDGCGEGWLEIPTGTNTGYYYLVAYTRYMKNEGEKVFFRKNIGIINPFKVEEDIEIYESTLSSATVGLDNTISVTTDKVSYSLRSGGVLRLDRLPKNIHSLSVSIAGDDIGSHSPVNILNWQQQLPALVNSGFVENILPEYEGHIIEGKLINIDSEGSSIEEELVPLLAFVGDEIRLFGGQVNNRSDVLFYTKRTSGMPELVTTVISPSNNKYRVDILSPYFIHSDKSLPTFRLNSLWEEQLLKRSVGLQVLHTYMADSLNQFEITPSYLNFKPDWTYILDEYTRFTTMEEVIIEFVLGLRFRRIGGRRTLAVLTEERTGFTVGNSLVLLDGIPITDHEVVFRYDPLLLRQIDVYKGKFVFSGQMFDGIASFRTYNNDYPGLTLDNTNQFFDYEGTQARRLFYAPDYSTEEAKKSRIPDSRHTLLWNPNIQTNGDTSINVPFSTSDLSGEYLITVEGLTEDGQMIYGNYRFQVE